MREHIARVAVAVGVIAVAAIAFQGALAATGDTQTVGVIDDFEDGDTNIERADWSGWTVTDATFSTTSNALSGSTSGEYVPISNDNTQALEATRAFDSQQWANATVAVDGEQGSTVTHELRLRDDGATLLAIQYEENSSDSTGPVNVVGSSTTQIDAWSESGSGADEWAIDPDFGADQAEVYLNGTSQGTFSLAQSAPGWDGLQLESEPNSQAVDDTSIRIDDVGSSFTATDPTVKNATASPEGRITQARQTLSIDVEDADFGDDHDDALNATWYKDGAVVDNETVTSNGTITETVRFSEAGEHNWSVNVTDGYNGSTVSETFNVTTPSNLTIRDENNVSNLVNNTEAEIIFFYDDQPTIIDERSTTNGTLNMTGLPADRPFVVSVSGDGWTDRRIYVRSLYQSQSVYLVNTTSAANNSVVQPTFDLRDFSGSFPAPETVLLAQAAINESWQTVEGDFFGGDGEMTATLSFNERHRLVLLNTETGQEQIFNAFFPTATKTHDLTVNADDIEVTLPSGVADIAPSGGQLPEGNTTIAAEFRSNSEDFDLYQLNIYANDSGSRTEIRSLAGTQDGGDRLAAQVNLTGRAGERIEVRAGYVLDGGSLVIEWRNFTVRENQTSATLIGGLTGVPSRLSGDAAGVTAFLATFAAALAAAAVGRRYAASTELLGLVMVGVLGIAYVIGWIPPTTFAVVAVAWVAAAAVQRGL